MIILILFGRIGVNTKNKQFSEPKSYNSLTIQGIETRRNPSKMVLVRHQMHIAVRVNDKLKAKEWSQRQFGINVVKRPSDFIKVIGYS